MVEWIGPCIPRGNASHAPLGRVEGDHILHGWDTLYGIARGAPRPSQASHHQCSTGSFGSDWDLKWSPTHGLMYNQASVYRL